jgi:hypothetical protein
MKHFIVTPLYLITKDLAIKIRELKDEDLTIIITDDVNPIIPLDTRINWLRRTFVGQQFDIESIVQNDESSEFKGAIEKTISQIVQEDYKGYIFLTQRCHEDNSFEKLERHDIAPPLEVNFSEVCDELFFRRFESDIVYVYRNKANDEIEDSEIIQVIACFDDGDTTYFGFLDVYKPIQTLRTLEMEIPKFSKVSDVNKILRAFVPKFFQSEVVSNPILLGWVYDENQYVVKVEKPKDLDMRGEFGARLFLDEDCDIVFIPKEALKLSDNPYMHWLFNKVEELADGE